MWVVRKGRFGMGQATDHNKLNNGKVVLSRSLYNVLFIENPANTFLFCHVVLGLQQIKLLGTLLANWLEALAFGSVVHFRTPAFTPPAWVQR